jgi:hypothetical protein
LITILFDDHEDNMKAKFLGHSPPNIGGFPTSKADLGLNCSMVIDARR